MSALCPQPPRKRRLVIEFELPDHYVEDIPELLAGFGPPDMDRGEAILGAIGEINYGALTVEVSGEKDSEIVTVPVLARTARIEGEPPSEIEHLRESINRLVERANESATATAYDEGYDDGLEDGHADGEDRS